MANNNSKSGNNTPGDLKDSAKDVEEMKSEPFTIDLPDVSDIPGQENIVPPSLNELADMTASSADEEGDEIFGDDIDQDTEGDPDANVSASEAADLEEAANDVATDDDMNLHKAALDDTDEDGEPLNEGSGNKNVTGSDLDVPGSEDDDLDEELGEEDEENNSYSVGGDNNDDIPEDSF